MTSQHSASPHIEEKVYVPSNNTKHMHWLQIRKYMYQYVVRIQDIQEHFDTSGVQTYIINSARVVFLRDRKSAGPTKVNIGKVWIHLL